ncbi:glutamyl-tRNA reductase [Fictibacillus enclensis]|uniref:Glutamyl-tRNA reductase n=1 Tax=Fictibacillus enclensis TaxID=1017270 RepID=A0A0V8J9T6_9BACL|nr:glutamyl-tRNA reductase [Fictibacillus enclensis]KSU83753.1 glutamyl-tRNA reductase [Fictibacillus enclensis]SCC20623.1 glutamyl-tRNA reductase [Fictibacillus enclensis]
MHILVVGLNYKTAPVEIREKVSFQPTELAEAHKALRARKSILECTIVSTCNRTEVYAVVDQLHTGRYYMKSFLAEWFSIETNDLNPFLFIREEEISVEHLFRVAAGLDSMVLGETQILGQVRDSFLLAQQEGTTGTIFNHLFKQAITLAKRSHSETEIGENAVSVSYAAVELAKKIFGGLEKKDILIVGAGKMGELTAKHLHSNGVASVHVVNRTYEKALELAGRFNGTAHPMEELGSVLNIADIVITSTGSESYVITKEMVQSLLKQRKGRPLFMVDIAVPRDLDPGLNELESVFLYDIDDLEGIVEANLAERKKEAEKIEIMIEGEIVAFQSWVNMLGVVPVITALREKALAVQAETMQSIERKMPHLSDREKKVLSKHTKSIVNQLLRDPIVRIKEQAGEPGADQALEFFTKIFALEEEVKQQQLKTEKETSKLREASPSLPL